MWIYIVAGIGAVLLLLLLLPVVVFVRYDQTVTLWVQYGLIRFGILPKSPKKADSEKKKKRKQKNRQENDPGTWHNLTQKHGVLGTVELMIGTFASLSKGALRLLKGARIRRFQAEIRVTGKDAAEAALTYGRVCSVLYPFLGAVDKHMKFVRPHLNLVCDYQGQQPVVKGQAAVYISLYHAGWTALHLLFELIRNNLKTKVVK